MAFNHSVTFHPGLSFRVEINKLREWIEVFNKTNVRMNDECKGQITIYSPTREWAVQK
jgi:hypothetical protein